jgi:hypothetical protein
MITLAPGGNRKKRKFDPPRVIREAHPCSAGVPP